MAFIEFKNVSFKYRGSSNMALCDVNISLNQGQIVGLLGPNGSGKTTFIKILVGLLKTYKGEVLVDGQTIGPESKALISYLPDSTYLEETFSIQHVILMFKTYYTDFDENKFLSMLEIMQINPQVKIKTLSKGNKEKLQLALILSRNAKVYILDEPIAGVDPVQRDFIIQTILTNYAKDAIVIICTHLIEDIQDILDRAIFINCGKIILDDTCENLTNIHEGKTLNEIFKEEFR